MTNATTNKFGEKAKIMVIEKNEIGAVNKLSFGVDSRFPSNVLLQNNLELFEWVKRNKSYPIFWCRNINGENAVTKEEIEFLHDKACKVAVYYSEAGEKQTEEQGANVATIFISAAKELGIPNEAVLYLEISESETATGEFILAFATTMLEEGYVPGFKANTDAAYSFDREFGRASQMNINVMNKCLVWAVAPTIAEYDRITTTHLIQPNVWKPFAPSFITRRDISIWQYGKECHPIETDEGKKTTFNINLIRNNTVITENMF